MQLALLVTTPATLVSSLLSLLVSAAAWGLLCSPPATISHTPDKLSHGGALRVITYSTSVLTSVPTSQEDSQTPV